MFLLFANLLVKPFYIFGIDRTVQNRVGNEEFGTFAALWSFTFIFNILNEAGLQSYNSRIISGKPVLASRYLSVLLPGKIILAFVYTLVVCIVGLFIGYGKQQWPLIFTLCGIQIMASMLMFLRTFVAATGKYTLDSFLSVLDRFLLIIGMSILLWVVFPSEKFEIIWFAYAQLISLTLVCILTFGLIRQTAKNNRFSWSIPLFLNQLKKSSPYALVIFLMTVYSRLDIWLLERLISDQGRQAGVYAGANRLLDAINMVGFLFAGLLIPMWSKQLQKKEDTKPLTSLALKVILFISISFSIPVSFYGLEIMEILYKERVIGEGTVLSILILSFIPVGLGYVFGSLLTAGGQLKKLNKLIFWAIVLNLSLNLFLIPRYGAVGAAISAFITQILAAILQGYLCSNYPGWERSRKELVSLLLFLILVIGWGISPFSKLSLGILDGKWSFFPNILLYWILCLIFAIITRFLPLRKFYTQFSNPT
jgi:O-antigen/teichoic acid export membrane protein